VGASTEPQTAAGETPISREKGIEWKEQPEAAGERRCVPSTIRQKNPPSKDVQIYIWIREGFPKKKNEEKSAPKKGDSNIFSGYKQQKSSK